MCDGPAAVRRSLRCRDCAGWRSALLARRCPVCRHGSMSCAVSKTSTWCVRSSSIQPPAAWPRCRRALDCTAALPHHHRRWCYSPHTHTLPPSGQQASAGNGAPHPPTRPRSLKTSRVIDLSALFWYGLPGGEGGGSGQSTGRCPRIKKALLQFGRLRSNSIARRRMCQSAPLRRLRLPWTSCCAHHSWTA